MIAILGAGAAGLMSAIFAAGSGEQVLVIERTVDGGRKILISGGGRCNVLPSEAAVERFVTDSPGHVMRGLLRSWPLAGQRRFFERDLGVALALEPGTGKLFPASNRARDVRDTLVGHARRRNVSFAFDTHFAGLAPTGRGWRVDTSRGPIDASRVIIATGGLSVPSTGSDGGGLRVAESLGLRVNPVYPALTPLLANPPVHADLSGISLTVRLRARSGRVVAETRGGFLFTHRGYSGPAVLDLSHVAVRSRESGPPAAVHVQWTALDARAWEAAFAGSSALALTTIANEMPQRLAAHLLREAGVPADRRASQLRRDERLRLIDRLTACPLPWTGDEGFKKAEVTGGGVALDELDPRTLESRKQAGLFVCGEILDAFGPIGGHNFAWAWATGRLAGLGASRHAQDAPPPAQG